MNLGNSIDEAQNFKYALRHGDLISPCFRVYVSSYPTD